jgi:ATP-dependent DNA helicase RecG
LDIEDIDTLLIFCKEGRTIAEMLSYMNYSDRTMFRKKYIYPLLDAELIKMTISQKPNSRNQKYLLTAKGLELIDYLVNNK